MVLAGQFKLRGLYLAFFYYLIDRSIHNRRAL